MPSQPLHIFDPRRNFQLQGSAGLAATTTIHNATATGISIVGIFQAAEDFAVLGFWSVYDYFNHLRVKHLPTTDLSGLTLGFGSEYDHTLDSAMRVDAAKFPSVYWDAMTFVCGAGDPNDIYEVRLHDHVTVVSGGETPASCQFDAGGIAPSYGIDYLHLYFRDTRYTVAHTDSIVETTLSADMAASRSAQDIPVASSTGIEVGDYVYLERTGTNEELVRVDAVRHGHGPLRGHHQSSRREFRHSPVGREAPAPEARPDHQHSRRSSCDGWVTTSPVLSPRQRQHYPLQWPASSFSSRRPHATANSAT